MDQAVDDRLRTKKIAVFHERRVHFAGADGNGMGVLFAAGRPDCEVRAFTTVIDGFDRKTLLRMVAEHLGISIHLRDLTGKNIRPQLG